MAKKKSNRPQPSTAHRVNQEGFELLLKRAGFPSQRRFALKVGLDPSHLSRLLSGERRLSLELANMLSQATQTPLDELLKIFGVDFGDRAESAGRVIKIEGRLDGKLIAHTDGLRGRTTVASPFPDTDIRALRCQTAGSDFQGLDGVIVFYRPTPTFDRDSIGRPSIVKIQREASPRLRVLRRGYESGRYDCLSLNGKVMEEDVSVESTSPVVWMKF